MSVSAHPVIVWFRDDLRIQDNPALNAAVATGKPVVCLYIFDEVSPGIRPLGGAVRWWLHHSLASLHNDLEELGSRLAIRRGQAGTIIEALCHEIGASAVFWNRRYGAAERRVDESVKTTVRQSGREATSFGANLLHEPWTIRTGAGTAFSVYTPFWRACLARPTPRTPLASPDRIQDGPAVSGTTLASLPLLPTTPDWSAGLDAAWTPGESHAHEDLASFVHSGLDRYIHDRDFPAIATTSRLSPRLRFGEISPFQVWRALQRARTPARAAGISGFIGELGWREFAYHTLFEHPDMATVAIHREYDAFPWPRLDNSALGAWQQGQTGIPLVDAGMRELWTTGLMHNRVRMVVASFLTKNLLIDWRLGEQWFWDTLVDADAASNPFNWQWVAGSGADAAPYFRVFNPDLQREKFDPTNTYVERWVPEWLSAEYPEPIVNLADTRRAALAAFDTVKAARTAARET